MGALQLAADCLPGGARGTWARKPVMRSTRLGARPWPWCRSAAARVLSPAGWKTTIRPAFNWPSLAASHRRKPIGSDSFPD